MVATQGAMQLWLFRGFFVALIRLEKQCSGIFRWRQLATRSKHPTSFRGFTAAFSWLFGGPHFGQILCVLALEKSSELKST